MRRNMKYSFIPLALSFRYSEIKEFRIYTDSENRVKVCDTSQLSPTDFWPEEIKQKESFYKELLLIFVNDTKLSIIPHHYSFNYRLKDKIIEIYCQECGRWLPFAYTDGRKVILKLGLVYFDKNKRRIVNYDETKSGALDYAGLSSIRSLKGLRTEIAWCNIHYVFQ